MAGLNVSVDPYSVAEPMELPDWRLPLSFMKSRHVERIVAREESEEWRIRDRVGTTTSPPLCVYSVCVCVCR